MIHLGIHQTVDSATCKYERLSLFHRLRTLYFDGVSQTLVPEATGVEWTVCYRSPSLRFPEDESSSELSDVSL